MKLIDGLKLEGRPAEIPDCSRDDLPQFFVDMGYKVGAEIGAYKGQFTEKFCQAGLKIYAIDPWRIYQDYGNPRGQKRLDFQYEHTKRVLAPYPDCTIVRKTSMEAVRDFEDESLDFVYIDGNHLLKYVVEDICEWAEKVKKGGAVSGHDFYYTNDKNVVIHVPYAVRAYIGAYEIQNWYVLGRKEFIEGEKRDKWRSWMWIKT